MPPPLPPFLFLSACLISLPLVLVKDACPPYRRGRGHNRGRPRGCPLSLPLPLLCSCLFVLVPFPPSPTILICLSPSFFFSRLLLDTLLFAALCLFCPCLTLLSSYLSICQSSTQALLSAEAAVTTAKGPKVARLLCPCPFFVLSFLIVKPPLPLHFFLSSFSFLYTPLYPALLLF